MPMTPLQQRQKQFGAYLVKGFPSLGLPGWPLRSAAAVCGNATQENACLPVTSGAKDHGSDGTMQWRLQRLTDMETWCVKNFGKWNTLEAQAAFMMHEVKTKYPGLYIDLVHGTGSLDTLTSDICWEYERPAEASANIAGRIKAAADSQKLIGSGTPIATSATKTGGAVIITGAAAGAAAGAAHWSNTGIWFVIGIILVGLVTIFAFISEHLREKAIAATPITPTPLPPPVLIIPPSLILPPTIIRPSVVPPAPEAPK